MRVDGNFRKIVMIHAQCSSTSIQSTLSHIHTQSSTHNRTTTTTKKSALDKFGQILDTNCFDIVFGVGCCVETFCSQ